MLTTNRNNEFYGTDAGEVVNYSGSLRAGAGGGDDYFEAHNPTALASTYYYTNIDGGPGITNTLVIIENVDAFGLTLNDFLF